MVVLLLQMRWWSDDCCFKRLVELHEKPPGMKVGMAILKTMASEVTRHECFIEAPTTNTSPMTNAEDKENNVQYGPSYNAEGHPVRPGDLTV